MLFQELHTLTDSDDNEIFVNDRSKKRNTMSPRFGVIDDNEGSQFDGDTPVIMPGRPLGHDIRAWDLRYGPCLATMRTNICKYTVKLVTLTMMVIIGLWMCHGEGHQRHKPPKENPQ